jgi:hypothetical protein
MVTGQAPELAPAAGLRHQFDAAVASPALWTDDIGLPHKGKVAPRAHGANRGPNAQRRPSGV